MIPPKSSLYYVIRHSGMKKVTFFFDSVNIRMLCACSYSYIFEYIPVTDKGTSDSPLLKRIRMFSYSIKKW